MPPASICPPGRKTAPHANGSKHESIMGDVIGCPPGGHRVRRALWRGVIAGLLLLVAGARTGAAQSILETMAAAIGPADARRAIVGLATQSAGMGPRGAFTTDIVSHGEMVRFVQARDGAETSLLVVGTTAFARVSAAEPMQATIGPEVAIVLGHALHRLLLDLEGLVSVTAEDAAAGCIEGTTAAGRVRLCRQASGPQPARMTLNSPGAEDPVIVEFSEWRRVLGVTLPFAIDYVQGGGRYAHRFVAVMPFTLAPGIEVPTDPGTAFDRLGDLMALAALHRGAIDAHATGDVARLAAGEFGRSTVARRGELIETTREALVGRLGPYLQSITFARYEDVRVPVVAVSNDGSVGWIACEIEAEGHEVEPQSQGARVAYAFAWIETAIKHNGRWLRNGNASSARPQPAR
jgi:hypothetical protein